MAYPMAYYMAHSMAYPINYLMAYTIVHPMAHLMVYPMACSMIYPKAYLMTYTYLSPPKMPTIKTHILLFKQSQWLGTAAYASRVLERISKKYAILKTGTTLGSSERENKS